MFLIKFKMWVLFMNVMIKYLFIWLLLLLWSENKFLILGSWIIVCSLMFMSLRIMRKFLFFNVLLYVIICFWLCCFKLMNVKFIMGLRLVNFFKICMYVGLSFLSMFVFFACSLMSCELLYVLLMNIMLLLR